MRLSTYWLWSLPSQGSRTAWLLIVMPRSRSMSIRSRYCARICRPSTTPVSCNIRSASVDWPWSMWAMMQKFRIRSGSVAPGSSVGGTVVRSWSVVGRFARTVGPHRTRAAGVPAAGPTHGPMPRAVLSDHGHAARCAGGCDTIPDMPSLPPVSYEATAHRPSWVDLPPPVRAAIERRVGGTVEVATSAGGGFTNGFAAVVSTRERTEFVKAVSAVTHPTIANSYRTEALINAALPAGVPAPRLRWQEEIGDWY